MQRIRDSTVYEILRKVGLDSSQCLYRPKLMREMKFVAHDSTIAHDFIRNRVLYTRVLRVIVNTHNNKDLVEEARGFIVQLTDEIWLLDVFLLVPVTRVLKRFSTQFQVSLFTTFTFTSFWGLSNITESLLGQFLSPSKISLKLIATVSKFTHTYCVYYTPSLPL